MSTKKNRPGEEGLIEAAALGRLEAAGSRGVSQERLLKPLEERWSRDQIRRVLSDLEGRGRFVELDGTWLLPELAGLEVGRVEVLEGGDGQATRLDQPDRKPAYIARRDLGGAMTGDLVVLEPVSRRRSGGVDRRAVVKIARRRHGTMVGTVDWPRGGSRRRFQPYDSRVDLDVAIVDYGPADDDLDEEIFVVVEVDAPGASGRRGRKPLRGRIVEVLGHPDDPGVDVEVVLRHYEIPDAFPAEVLRAAERLGGDPDADRFSRRLDLRDQPIVTIDGASARDFDDGVSVEALPGGLFRLGVHIADVAEYVAEGSALDREAYHRGTSVYYPERAVPMLPEALSNGLCSLRPEVPRLCLSVFLEIDEQGEVRSRELAESVIRSHRRMTYSEVRRLLEEPEAGDRDEYGPLLDDLEAMRRLMRVLLERRQRDGSIDFDLPEGDVILDTDGFTVGIRPEERNVAHRIVEEFMIAANKAVARALEDAEAPALHRTHGQPSPERLDDLQEVLGPLGLRIKGDFEELPADALQEVLRAVEGREDEAFLTSLILRSMDRAVYSPESRGHYALAAPFYCHFTSPIRRYPDLVVHRQLKRLIRSSGRGPSWSGDLADRLPAIAAWTSQTERRAERSERDLLQWKKVRFMEDRVGEEFDGRITGVQPFGLFVQLDDLYVDGLVPIRSLGEDYYRFDPERHRLVGEHSGETFRLSDPIKVRLVGVSQRYRGLDLMPVERRSREPRRRSKGRREGGKGAGRRRRKSRSW